MIDAPKLKDKMNQISGWPVWLAERELRDMYQRGEIAEVLVLEGAINWLRENNAKNQSSRFGVRDLCFFGFGLLTSPFLYILWTFVRGI